MPLACLNNLQIRQTPQDTDAFTYLSAVRLSGGMELAVRMAVNRFVQGCKTDGIWDAIQACCILAGARTLNGALIPLKGSAPTNVNFVSADYNRKTGLKGDGSSKCLNSNRLNNSDPQDNNHNSIYVTTTATAPLLGRVVIGATGATNGINMMTFTSTWNRAVTSSINGTTPTGFYGISRNNSTGYDRRINGNNSTVTQASTTPNAVIVNIFSRRDNSTNDLFSDARLSFYSIGKSLDLALLDSRVTTLMNTLSSVLP